MTNDSLKRFEHRLAELSSQISEMRKELFDIARMLESTSAGHSERIENLESFRRWMVGLMTGVFLSGVAAMLGWIVK